MQNELDELKKRLLAVIEGYKTTFGKNKPTDAKAEKPAENSQLKTEFDKITAQVKQFQQSKDASEREKIAFELGQAIENWEDLYSAANETDKKAAAPMLGNIQKLKTQLGRTTSTKPAETSTEAKPESSSETPAETSTEAKPEGASETPAETSTEAKPEGASETPAETSTEAKPEGASEIPAETSTEAKPEGASETPTETSTEAKPEGASETPAETSTEAKPESASEKPADATEKNAEAKSESTAEKTADTMPKETAEKITEAKSESTKETNTTKLSASVGQGGTNNDDDTKLIQTLLNKNGASPALVVDGIVGPKTIAAISQFQSSKLGFSDGLVEVNKQTWNALNGSSETKPTDAAEKPTETKPTDAAEKPAETKPTNATEKPAETKPTDATEKPAENKPLVPSTTLSASVGEKGTNKPEDVALVKTLINKFMKSFDLNDKANIGLVGKTTIDEIKKFQQTKVGLTNPDGLIEVGGKSWKVLSGETKPVETVSAESAGGNAALAQEVAASAKSEANSRNTVGRCYAAVADAVERVMGGGIFSGNSAYMAAGQMKSLPNLFKEVSASPSNVKSLPIGTIVVWAAGGGPSAEHGHITVCIGGGAEASDHIASPMYDWPGGSCRAFLPLSKM